ncbi:MAG: cytochrome-c peroxidase [Spirochaetota bacterium]
MSNTKYNSLPGAKPHPAYGTSPLDKGRGRGWGLFLLLATLLLNACVAQDDKEVLFSDTELAIIKTLIYKAPDGEASNQYVNNSAAATLGQKFFWDPQFSGGITVTGNRNGTTFAVDQHRRVACVTCHVPSFGWADNNSNPNNVSLGAGLTNRNSPTVLNTSFNTYSTWTGGTDSVWAVMRPGVEAAANQNFSRTGVAAIICTNATYLADYTAVFGAPTCGGIPAPNTTNYNSANNWGRDIAATSAVNTIFANFGKAIGAYEHLLVSKNSAFDQWAEGNENAMSASQKRGLKIFIGKGNCVRCHSGPNFSDGSFHNLGVPQIGGALGVMDDGRYTGISDLLTGSNSTFNTNSGFNATPSVNRVSGLARTDADIGKFKTPTLRSVNKTPPYFHNGTFNSLWDVVNFYNFAGNAGNFPGTKDPVLTTRRMTNEEMEDLVNFLKALEGEALSTTLTTGPCAGTGNICGTTGTWAP